MNIKILDESYLDQILKLQLEIVNQLKDKRILQPLTKEEFLTILKGQGIMVGVFEQEKLVAFRALLKPDILDTEHLGLDVGANDLSRVLYQEVSVVHFNQRGQGLQRKMGDYIMLHIDKSQFDWVCATVMPFNIASIKDKLAQGLYIYALKMKYGGKLRYIFGKKLNEEKVIFTEKQTVLMSETAKQQQLLNKGYVGTSIFYENENWLVCYEK